MNEYTQIKTIGKSRPKLTTFWRACVLPEILSDDFVEILNVTVSESEKFAPLGNLTNKEFDLIKSENGWLDDTVIHQAQVFLRQQNPNVDGFQRLTLGPWRNFNVVTSDFIQILHTGNSHWVCVSSIGCPEGQINLYDSLYNIIATEVEEQMKSLLGGKESKIIVAPVQQQGNGSDCGVFAIAFATCLVHLVGPVTVDFDIPKTRPHLISCFKSRFLHLFPVL